MKFKVGDKVVLKPTENNLKYFSRYFAGIDHTKVFVITELLYETSDCYCVKLDCKNDEYIAAGRMGLVKNVYILPEDLFVL